jgi:hypothetical protein
MKRAPAAKNRLTNPPQRAIMGFMSLIQKAVAAALEDQRHYYRDKRDHYASSALDCIRDQVWSMRGEAETDVADYFGRQRMMFGKALEEVMIKQVFEQMKGRGVHVLAQQVAIGGTSPNWNGYIDVLVAEKIGEKKVVRPVEIKSKYGFGATLFKENLEVQPGHLVQLGLYLRELVSRNPEADGVGYLWYYLVSDGCFGEQVEIECRYDGGTGCVEAYMARTSEGEEKKLKQSYDLKMVDKTWLEVDKHVAEGTTPKPTYAYRYPLTKEYLARCSDEDIRKAALGEKILGDWQARYSRYLKKALELDGVSREYSVSDKRLLGAEYARRKPKQRTFNADGSLKGEG